MGKLKVSVIINNYNYERFVGAAIESALAQTYPNTEVIVVDDGSTDGSRAVIERYGDRIIPIFKPNGGQASALNVGFPRASGDVIILLDSDDMLTPETAAKIVPVYEAHPDSARVQFRMAIVDAQGAPTGPVIPPVHVPMVNADLRRQIVTLDSYGWCPPTSGNSFSAAALRKVVPAPEETFVRSIDYYLSRATALCGPVRSIDDVGALYRFHGSNGYLVSTINLERIHKDIRVARTAHPHIKRIADSLGLYGMPDEATETLNLTLLMQRLVSIKLDPKTHTVPGDTLPLLVRRGTIATMRRDDFTPLVKLMHILWFIAVALSPRPVAFWLAEKLFYPDTRKQFNQVLGFVRGITRRATQLRGRPSHA